jgi:signal transduction histidine kinase
LLHFKVSALTRPKISLHLLFSLSVSPFTNLHLLFYPNLIHFCSGVQLLGCRFNSSAKSTLILLDNLLNWANFQTGQINFNPENLHFALSIQEILDISILSAKIKNISLNYIQSEDIEVYADLNMLKTVLRNLISNAIKFTDSEGSIKVNALQKNNCIAITISDDGVGMNEETMNKLFQLHTNVTVLGTAKENGSGLGLLLCK